MVARGPGAQGKGRRPRATTRRTVQVYGLYLCTACHRPIRDPEVSEVGDFVCASVNRRSRLVALDLDHETGAPPWPG